MSKQQNISTSKEKERLTVPRPNHLRGPHKSNASISFSDTVDIVNFSKELSPEDFFSLHKFPNQLYLNRQKNERKTNFEVCSNPNLVAILSVCHMVK